MGMSTRIIALTADLMFASNIEATLRRNGYEVTTVEDDPSLQHALRSGDAGLVILDLHAGVEAEDVVKASATARGERADRSATTTDAAQEPQSAATAHGVPVLAFGRHTEPALLRAAREAGCVEVVPRSTFVEEMPALVARVMEKQ